jgi:hypothetical protein
MFKKDGFYNKMLKWARNHKKISAFFLVVIAVVLTSFVWILLYNNVGTLERVMNKSSLDYYESDGGVAPESDHSLRGSTKTIEDTSSPYSLGIRVVDSNITIESEEAREEESKIKQIAESYDGYVEESSLSESTSFVRIDMKLRVPLDDFETFFEELKNSTEVEGFNVRDYRIDVERRETDLDTVQKAIAMYSEMLENIKTMPLERETVEVMSEIVSKEIDLRQQENYLMSSLQESRRQSEYSTVRVAIIEKVSPKIWPEDLGDDFRENIHKSFNSVGKSVTSIVGNSLMVFVKAIEWIVYITIVIVSFWIFAVIVRKIHKTTKK